MKLGSFVRSKWIYISLQLCIIILMGSVMSLLKINKSLILLLLFSFGIILILSVVIEYHQKNKYYQNLYLELDELKEKYLISEIMKKSEFVEEEILQDILRLTTKSMNDKISQYQHNNEEYGDYIETWIHEIKLPIATISLLCENNKNEITKDIEIELRRIDSFVEQALYYAKGNALEKDYLVKRCNLDSLVKATIKKESKSLILAKANFKFEDLNKDVYCDIKWLTFILTQIISNSIKYKKEELILSFYTTESKDNIILHIEDNGVGINEQDIDRVFNKGFTGENGRQVTKSTGIGLYLFKKLCSKMNLDITISSTFDVGTIVSITFPKDSRILLEN
ncbi:MAG: sensor histidine kinase [Erysipelotrichaceae bacterium]